MEEAETEMETICNEENDAHLCKYEDESGETRHGNCGNASGEWKCVGTFFGKRPHFPSFFSIKYL